MAAGQARSSTSRADNRRLAPRQRLGALVVASLILTVLPWLAAPPARANGEFAARMVELINEARAAAGVGPLTRVLPIEDVAQDAPYAGCGFPISGRAIDMGDRDYFSHTITSCGGANVYDLLSDAGIPYTAASENIGWMAGSTDPLTAAQILHDGFMNSTGHRTNLLDGRFNAVGVGSWSTTYGESWTGGGTARTKVTLTAVVFAKVPNGFGAPTAPPGAPAIAHVEPGHRSVTAVWTPVTSTSAAPVDAYAVLLYDSNGYTGNYRFVSGTTTSVSFTGLVDGGVYAVGVLAGNAVGWGGITYSGFVTAGTPPAPRNVTATGGPSRLTVSWSPSAIGGGSPVQNYAALAYYGDEFSGQYTLVCGTCTSTTITGLRPGQAYYVLVLPYNAYGFGAGGLSPPAVATS